ncbi:hypothetical protein [Lacticaseibacillus songhuajiangensis]|jgi:hypothetical protein|uniref:hypothetical protein n=1 Tax=Lacticaseibacillus songhuajiangensis TaxID=1296539 RepID=UPI000F782227|nr:hypothetical protein [Lacticaseibacillus songhuajiangensis]
MAKTDIRVERVGLSPSALIEKVEAKLQASDYPFLALAFRQGFTWARTDEEKLDLIKQYVTIVD